MQTFGDWAVLGRIPVYDIDYVVAWISYIFISATPPGPKWRYRLEHQRTGARRSLTLDHDHTEQALAEAVGILAVAHEARPDSGG